MITSVLSGPTTCSGLTGGSGRCNRVQEPPKSGQERFQLYFFRLQERSRALQEASKRVPEGFRVEDTIRIPFWIHFGGLKREPGTSKIIKILAKVVKNQGFAILSLDRFLTSILGPLGSGALIYMGERVLEPFGAEKNSLNRLLAGPRGPWRLVSAIFGAKWVPKASPKESQNEVRKQFKLKTTEP